MNTKNLKRLMITAVFFIILLCVNSKVNATSINISPSNPKVGDTVTVTVSISNVNTASITANVSGVASGTIKVVGGDLSGQPSTYSKSESFYCSKEGTLNVSVSSDSSAVLNGEYVNVGASASVNVTSNNQPNTENPSNNNNQNNGNNGNNANNANNANNGNSGTSNNTTTPPATTKSNNANLNNLGITPNDFRGFKPGTKAYNVTVPNNVEQVTVYAKLQDSKAKLTGTGVQKLKVGKNALNVVVTAEDGTQNTYTINVTREEENTSTTDNNTTPQETSGEETSEGENSENQNEENTNTSNSDLLKLEIAGYTLTPEFSPDIYEYTLSVNENISSLDIIAEGANHNVNVEIAGNTNLKDGENIITILVNNEETKENSTYQIVVNKTNIDLDSLNTTLNDAVKKANKVRYILLGIVIFVIVCFIIFIVAKHKYRQNEIDDIYDYDDEDKEKINLDEEEEFFNRVNREKLRKPEEEKVTTTVIVNPTAEDTQEEGNVSNVVEEADEEQEQEIEQEEEFFRTSKSKKKGKHF